VKPGRSGKRSSRRSRTRGQISNPVVLAITATASTLLAATVAISWWAPLAILACGTALLWTFRWLKLLVRRDPRALLALWIIFALNASAALLVPLQFQRLVTRLDDASLATALIVILLTHHSKARTNAWTTAAFLGLSIYTIVGILSGLGGGLSWQALTLGSWLGSKLLICSYIATRFTWTTDQVRIAYRFAIGLLSVVLTVAVAQFLAPSVFSTALGAGNRVRLGVPVITSIFKQPAQYAVFTLLALSLILAAAPLTRSRTLGAALIAGAALLSLRLKALIDIVLTFAGRAATSPSVAVRTLTPGLLISGAAAAGYFGAGLIGDRAGALFGTAGDAPRQTLYTVAASIASTRAPLGAGFGSFGSQASIQYYSPLYGEYGLSGVYGFTPNAPIFVQDASWATILGEGGWLGAAGFVLALGALAMMFWHQARTLTSDIYQASARAGFLFLMVYIADSVTTPELFAGFPCMSLAILWSMTLGSGNVTTISPMAAPGRSATGTSRHGKGGQPPLLHGEPRRWTGLPPIIHVVQPFWHRLLMHSPRSDLWPDRTANETIRRDAAEGRHGVHQQD
jgi:hypothetical protein